MIAHSHNHIRNKESKYYNYIQRGFLHGTFQYKIYTRSTFSHIAQRVSASVNHYDDESEVGGQGLHEVHAKARVCIVAEHPPWSSTMRAFPLHWATSYLLHFRQT